MRLILIPLSLSVLLTTACTSVEFVRKDLTPAKSAILRYPPQSKPDKEKKHRDKLNEEATAYCGGPYTITREYEALTETPRSSGVTTGIGLGTGIGRGGFGTGIGFGTSVPREDNYHYVELACGEKN